MYTYVYELVNTVNDDQLSTCSFVSSEYGRNQWITETLYRPVANKSPKALGFPHEQISPSPLSTYARMTLHNSASC